MTVLFCVAEAVPFAKAGGLADVAGALPAALRRLGHDVRVVLPCYRSVPRDGLTPIRTVRITLAGQTVEATLHTGRGQGDVPFFFVDAPALYDRPGIYGDEGRDYPDNLLRFAVLCRAALAIVRETWTPELVHCHDWHTALLPAYLRWEGPRLPTLFTVHNLAHQGIFPIGEFPLTGLPPDAFTPDGVEFFGQVNVLKAGLVWADLLSTVSETYAREIQTPELGCGLDGVLRERSGALHGILNGADYSEWDPSRDPHLPARYSVEDLSGKARCKAALQKRFGLPARPEPPWYYRNPFAAESVIDEYTRPCRFRVDGREVTLEPLSGAETVEFPETGPLVAFHTDGIRTLLRSLPEVPTLVEKTLRHPQHYEFIVRLRDAGFFAPDVRPMLETVCRRGWRFAPGEADLTVMRLVLEGSMSGSRTRLLLDLVDLGLPAGCEFLDPITPQFISDLVTWGAIGARTTESQVHRELASGLSMPVGFKNGTDGGVQIAIDACRAAAHPHRFLGVTEQGLAGIVATRGNPDCHVILRGGHSGPNYDAISVQKTLAALRDAGLPARVMIDTSHGNSDKDHTRQPLVAREVGAQVAQGEAGIIGVMMESFLVEGRQDLVDPARLVYGQSITDACMGWSTTVIVLHELAEAVRRRRQARARG